MNTTACQHEEIRREDTETCDIETCMNCGAYRMVLDNGSFQTIEEREQGYQKFVKENKLNFEIPF